MRILVIQTAWIGDNILTLPLIQILAEAGNEVEVMTTPKAHQIYVNNPFVSDILLFDKNGADRGIGGILRIVPIIKSRNYGAALLAQRWWRSALIAFLAGIPLRIGFKSSPAKILYTKTVDVSNFDHEAKRLAALATPLGITYSQLPQPKLYPAESHRIQAHLFLSENAPKGKRLIFIAPGSAWETKRYPFFAEVGRKLVESGYAIGIVGTIGEKELCRSIAKEIGRETFVSTSNDILFTSALFSFGELVIANDSGAGHIAAASGVPVVSIFGPTTPEMGFYPLASKAKVVEVNLECRPCGPHGHKRCPKGHHNCMRLIKPEEVVAAALSLIE